MAATHDHDNDIVSIQNLNQFHQLLDKETRACLVDFYADWCGPCKMMGPVLKMYAERESLKSLVCFVKVDVDVARDVAEACVINAMPTFQAYVHHQKIGEFTGARKDQLHNLVEACCRAVQEKQEAEQQEKKMRLG